MSYEVSLKQRIQQLKKIEADLPAIFTEVAEGATIMAVEAAVEATPPKANTGRGAYIGANTITGQLKAHWETDSRTEPIVIDGEYSTMLANNMEYASYVNDGHRMDKHFVPGLYINPYSGLLEKDTAADVGIMVGTKTKYVKGEFMVDKAKKMYEETVIEELDRKIKEAFK